MKTWTTTHACPVTVSRPWGPDYAYDGEAPCEAAVHMEYEVGTGADEFWPVKDGAACDHGHRIPAGVLNEWYTEDAADYASEQYDHMTAYQDREPEALSDTFTLEFGGEA